MRPRAVRLLCAVANLLLDVAERLQPPRRVRELDGLRERAIDEEYRRPMTRAETDWVLLSLKVHLARRNQSERA